MRLGKRRVRIKRTDLDAFIASGSSSREPEHGDDRQLVTKETSDAWGRYGTALAQAHASLAQPDRAVLVAALESLAEATNALARVLAG